MTSLMNQTSQNFEWIVLFDSKTPDEFKVRIKRCQEECRQLIPVFVEPADGRYFQAIFRREVIKRLKAPRVVTTYLDNDDALDSRFVEDLRRREQSMGSLSIIQMDINFILTTNICCKFIIRGIIS